MAIRIPILTSFDPKGLRQANAQFAKLQSSIGSLGRNFAAAGVAIGAAGAVIAKNAQSLARIERINAQTAQTIKSMGNASQISAGQVEQLAGDLEKLTATEAETIQEGANLLLTFKNIKNEAGAGNDIFNQTTAVMVDLARAMGTSASGEAIRLGKALNDPVKGIAALTRVGVSFTEEQKQQIKALAQSGDLMGAQKLILAELQAQFGGSGAAYAKTFSGQLELMGHELGTIGEEATMAVMPALQSMVTELRALIPVIGPQLKAAIESVDWKGLVTAVVDFTKFLVENGATIVKTAAFVFALNTAFKTLTVAVNLGKVAIALHTWAVAQAAGGMTLATIATNTLTSALKLVPWFAAVAGIVAIGTELVASVGKFQNYRSELDKTATSMSTLDKDSAALSATMIDLDLKGFSPFIKILQDAVAWALKLTGALDNIPKSTDIKVNIKTTGMPVTADTAERRAGGGIVPPIVSPTPTQTPKASGGGAGSQPKTVDQILRREGVLATREAKILKTGVSAGLAGLVTSTATTKKAFQRELAKLSKPGGAEKAQARFNKTAAGQAEVAAAAQAAAEAAAQAAAELTAATEAAAAAEADALAERERVYQSFADSVKNTFAGIKNSILNAFDLTNLGGSTNAITRNMDKLLNRLRGFATNVKNLASAGLNPALLQQIISAGPMGGARLAEALVMGGQAGLSAINAGYAEFGTLSGQIAQTGTESLFGTTAQQSVYNINVDGGVGSGSTIGKAIVDAIKAYERTSGAVWQGA